MKSKPRRAGPFRWCQGYGRPQRVIAAVDSVALALGCAARCLPAEEWIATTDSILNSTDWTIPDLQAPMGPTPDETFPTTTQPPHLPGVRGSRRSNCG
ncbi:hypothetical protein QSJ18_04575 [Gordonia sp. ABSL1-1]|uniref:hypothetical protein n=1 Tax=Gordonia sp. ABSL1-1 TaxID=3053923 RepID=UPI0025734266|nr:hypothetical protein [Gordonia sp. ABSL1-1]MDL9936010.1 hypothetical protein [Gordonia sp. ABSL1-1]